MTSARAVRVLTDVAALTRAFDYEVTDATSMVGVGDRVRVNLHGRSVRGWVWSFVDLERDLKPLMKWLGLGAPESLMSTVSYAAWRWCAPATRFLAMASPERIVTTLPQVPDSHALNIDVGALKSSWPPGVIQLAPSNDPMGLVLHAYESTRSEGGSLVVLVPQEGWARRLGGRLAQRGLNVAYADEWDKQRAGWPVIVGSRKAAFAPTTKIRGAVVIDADDEAYRSEGSPTWHAVDVLAHRCREVDAPLWLTSPCPSPSLRAVSNNFFVAPDQYANWSRVEVVDRREHDPRDGVLSAPVLDAAHAALRGSEPVAVVVLLQRLGAGRLLACKKCGTLARCARCGTPEMEVDDHLTCPTHCVTRERFCVHCASTSLRRISSGVNTLARDVAAQLGHDVSELTAASDPSMSLHRVVVGTEAIFTRLRRASMVVFADIDQYLLAPRERARRDALLAVARASRLVGSRRDGRGVLYVQSRRGDDSVLRALTTSDFDEFVLEDDAIARDLQLPPYGALAEITGEPAREFVRDLDVSKVTVVASNDGFVVSAPTVAILCDELATAIRPAGRLRVAIR